MKLLCGLITLLNLHDCLAVITFVIPPFNTTAGMGGNATLACIITGKGSTESVKWKKDGQSSALTLDAGTVGDSRYQVVGTYNLTIARITKADEGLYTCEIGTNQAVSDQKSAYLTVVELPRNVSVYWSTPPIAGTLANLTCKAEHANPAPNFSWFKDDRPYDYNTVHYTTPSSSGYVDAFSVLPVRLTADDQLSKFRCQLEYTGLSRAMEAAIVTTLSSASITQAGNIVMVLLVSTLALLERR